MSSFACCPDDWSNAALEEPDTVRVQTLRTATRAGIGSFTAMSIGVEDELWIVGERGLARFYGPKRSLNASSEWREFIPPQSLHLEHFQHPQPDENGLTLVADSSDGRPTAGRPLRWRTVAGLGLRRGQPFFRLARPRQPVLGCVFQPPLPTQRRGAGWRWGFVATSILRRGRGLARHLLAGHFRLDWSALPLLSGDRRRRRKKSAPPRNLWPGRGVGRRAWAKSPASTLIPRAQP